MDKNWNKVRGSKLINKKKYIKLQTEEYIIMANLVNIIKTELTNISNPSNIKKINTIEKDTTEVYNWLSY